MTSLLKEISLARCEEYTTVGGKNVSKDIRRLWQSSRGEMIFRLG